jgi:hypothetical protein
MFDRLFRFETVELDKLKAIGNYAMEALPFLVIL